MYINVVLASRYRDLFCFLNTKSRREMRVYRDNSDQIGMDGNPDIMYTIIGNDTHYIHFIHIICTQI